MDPLVSIIIPTYNNSQYINKAIKSSLHQIGDYYEIIVIDDGSKDDTEIVIREFLDKIIYIKQENLGPSSARNVGLQTANGKYITFLDSDDEFLPNKLKDQVSYLENNPQIDLVYSDGYRFFEDHLGIEKKIQLSIIGEVVPYNINPNNYFEKLVSRNIFQIHLALTKRKCIEQIGGFDEELKTGEDWDLWIRLSKSFRIAYLNCLVGKYRYRMSSNSTDLKRNANYFEKIMSKTEKYEEFLNLTPMVLSDFYYKRAINSLEMRSSKSAKCYFNKSLKYSKNQNKAIFGLLLVRILKDNAINFYKLKRKVLGKTGFRNFP